MQKNIFAITLLSVVFAGGCHHGRIVVSTDANDSGDSIRTRYRYRIVSDEKNIYGMTKTQYFKSLHPEVFSDDGIPIVIDTKNILNKKTGENTTLLPNLTFGLIPSVKTQHLHDRNAILMEGRQISSFDTCLQNFESYSMLPTSYLFFNGDADVCFVSGKTFSESCDNLGAQYVGSGMLTEKITAYGLATRLKKAEESGIINDRLVAKWRTVQSVTDISTLLNKILADERKRKGVEVKASPEDEQLFEVVKCEVQKGGDFAYVFSVRRHGGKAVSLADYDLVRRALRSAVKIHYVSAHENVNPRSLEVDFTQCGMKSGAVVGRVAVLTISPESLTYDKHRRAGVVRVKIGPGQFEDARRWLRRYLGDFANRRNIVLKGDKIPQGARFFSEGENMVDGVLEVTFRTE